MNMSYDREADAAYPSFSKDYSSYPAVKSTSNQRAPLC